MPPPERIAPGDSKIGIPPLVGFAGKYLVFTSAMASNMLLLVALGIVNSLIMVFYFGRLINSMFTAGRKEKVYMDWGTFIALAVPLFLIVLGIYAPCSTRPARQRARWGSGKPTAKKDQQSEAIRYRSRPQRLPLICS